jgi:hypothetical protein
MKSERNVKRPKFSLAHHDESMAALVKETGKRTLAIWAVDCAGRVLHFFEEDYPGDSRPRNALEACRAWIQSGVFSMADIRRAALFAHAAAREAGVDTAARSAARAAGQAVATAHVKTHAPGAALYALQAVFRSENPADADAAIAGERDWQYRHLLLLKEKFSPET